MLKIIIDDAMNPEKAPLRDRGIDAPMKKEKPPKKGKGPMNNDWKEEAIEHIKMAQSVLEGKAQEDCKMASEYLDMAIDELEGINKEDKQMDKDIEDMMEAPDKNKMPYEDEEEKE